jgi:hypothetical protein
MSILRRVERELEERLRRVFAGETRGRELLEIQRAILDEVSGKVQPVGRGRRVFPFRGLDVHIAAPDPATRPGFTLAFAEGDRLAADIREALRDAGCEPPAGLTVAVALEEREIPGGFSIVYHEKSAARARREGGAPAAVLVVPEGRALAECHPLAGGRVNIGRLVEVLDEDGRVVRRNQVAFAEGADPVAASVSRAHAHISYDEATGEYRLYDDRSSYGTSLFREGSLIQVPAGAGRGVALRAGDEIYFGQARARFELA